MGVEVEEGEITTSGYVAAERCAAENLRTVFLVGEPELHEVFGERAIRVQKVNDDEVQAVVVGICRSFDYEMLELAMRLIRRGARFLATNIDATYPVENGGLRPGAGSMVAAIRSCVEVDPELIGKPNPAIILSLLAETGVAPEDTLVVGDRYETDVAAGRAAGCATHLVLTGVNANAPPGQSFSKDLSGLPFD
jgi:4-nitrophenyl phosphatase